MGAIVIRTRHSSQLRLIPYLHHIEEAKRTHPRFADWRTRYDEGTESAEVATSGYNISALIRCNFIIKHYVNRKITSYIYLLIFTISLWIHVKHFIALTERESVRRIFFVITGQDYPCQHIDQWPRKTRENTIALATTKKKACVRIK